MPRPLLLTSVKQLPPQPPHTSRPLLPVQKVSDQAVPSRGPRYSPRAPCAGARVCACAAAAGGADGGGGGGGAAAATTAAAAPEENKRQTRKQRQQQQRRPRGDGWRDPGMAAGRVLFVGGIPFDSHAADATRDLKTLCPAATLVDLKDPHRGWALVAFRSTEAAAAAAAAIRAGAAAGAAPALGSAPEVAPAQRVPASWPAEATASEEELAEAARQREVCACALVMDDGKGMMKKPCAGGIACGVVTRLLGHHFPTPRARVHTHPHKHTPHQRAERHHEHLKRRRQRQRGELVDGLDALLGALRLPTPNGGGGGGGVWQQYSPLLQGLAAEWAAAGASAAATDALVARMPPRLAAALRRDRFEAALRDAAAAGGGAAAAIAGPIALAAAPDAAAVEARLLLDWSRLPAAVDPAIGGMLADADVVRAGKGRLNLRALRKRVQVEGFALALVQLLPHARRCATARRRQQQQQQQQEQEQQQEQQQQQLTVVDFGSGGGNLTLPLAWLFEELGDDSGSDGNDSGGGNSGGGRVAQRCRFVAVDLKPAAVAMVARRAADAGLSNVDVLVGAIEAYSGPADAVLALHACGAATDFALQQAAARRAAFAVSACCVGKINLDSAAADAAVAADGADGGGGRANNSCAPRLPPLRRPRSRALGAALASFSARQRQREQQATGGDDASTAAADPIDSSSSISSSSSSSAPEAAAAASLFAVLARVADFSHTEGHGCPDVARAAKAAVEVDRGLAAAEAGYEWRLCRLPQPELTAKAEVLLGWAPAAAAEEEEEGEAPDSGR